MKIQSSQHFLNNFAIAVEMLLRWEFSCATLILNVVDTTSKLSAHYIGVDAPRW
ncbi:hypothetical protein [Polaromonas sp.]|uniref:hypothetical protein n=1 Tax=Polaromonas sp. TaxID=1869339 RepID=UPI0037503114